MPGCENMMGSQPVWTNPAYDMDVVTIYSFMNLLGGAFGDALGGACGLCPADKPFCDPNTETCQSIDCTMVEPYCLEDSTAGVRARQICPEQCGCADPSSKLVLRWEF
jgi:hypothetical protein